MAMVFPIAHTVQLIPEDFSHDGIHFLQHHRIQGIKDILSIVTEVDMEDEQRKRFLNFMNAFMKLNKEDASTLFSNKGFIYLILSAIL